MAEPDTNEFTHLLQSVVYHHINEEAIKSLESIAKSTTASQRFVESLVGSQSNGVDTASDVYATMHILEEIAEKSELSACVFMAHLWPASDALQMHDVCDSIDLWLENCKLPELSQRLTTLANLQADDNLKRHYEQLAR